MLRHAPIVALLGICMAAHSYAARPMLRDGSTPQTAIRLKTRGAKAIDEEMQWMQRVHGYTPILAMRDALAYVIREAKAGKTVRRLSPWGHASIDHYGHLISYWWFLKRGGKKEEMYFDTGALIDTRGEVVRQESARAEYMAKKEKSLDVR